MKALYYTEAGKGSITEVDMPVCGDDQIIIKVASSSICKGVELGHESNGTGLSRYPVIPGHEFAGTVHEIGKNVTRFKPGDRVTADNTELCGDCCYCRADKPLQCDNFGSLGHNINGGFAEYVAVDRKKVFALPDSMSFDEGCLTEPVACCIHAMDKLDVKCGERVVVVGGGPNGQILSQLLMRSNAQSVVLMDTSETKLRFAEKYGIPTIKVDLSEEKRHIRELFERFPEGVDAVVDATGSWRSINAGFEMLKKGGRLLQYGVTHEGDRVTIDCFKFFLKELQYYSSMAQTHCFGRAIDYISDGTVKVKDMITFTCSLDDYFIGLDKNKNDPDQLKIVIHP
ncbi:MAG TPA: chlorophyll synthesis pathway protein BchC [Ruminococcaceae bacterium]|nr:chlorophyll synthesis pathway protein BchC [Oscillospiraceae bacterium]